MTKTERERWQGIAGQLEEKARRVLTGLYDLDNRPGENDAWAADLYSAAAKIRKHKHGLLTVQEREEIQCLQ